MDNNLDEFINITIGGHYQLEELIGKGGMGVVYKAYDLKGKREVAIKMLLPEFSRQSITRDMYDRFLKRFRREAAVMQLSHLHIMPIYDMGVAAEVNNLAYLVMPYISGMTLADKIERRGRLELHEALPYIQQIADALTTAHHQGIIHRDLKPGNLLLNDQGYLYVADFGIAHLEGSTLTEVGEFLGTRGYAAPEVVRGGKIDQRADIFSLGIVLYEMLTGELPDDSNDLSLLLSSEIADVIQKATAANPRDRYATARAFAQAVEQANNKLHNNATVYVSPARKRSYAQLYHASGLASLLSLSDDRLSLRSLSAIRQAAARLPKSSRIILAGLLFGLIAGLIAIRLSSLSPVESAVVPIDVNNRIPTVTTIAVTPFSIVQAQHVVQKYYTDWNNKDYTAAYALLDSTYQRNNSYAALLPDYQHTHFVCLSIDSATALPDGTIQVFITDNAIEDNMSNLDQQVVHLYTGYYIVRGQATGLTIEPHLSIQSGQVGSCAGPS